MTIDPSDVKLEVLPMNLPISLDLRLFVFPGKVEYATLLQVSWDSKFEVEADAVAPHASMS